MASLEQGLTAHRHSPSHLDSFRLIEKYSSEAEAWAADFRLSIPREVSFQALKSFQSCNFAMGLRDLRAYRRAVFERSVRDSAQRYLSLRWYYSVLAFYFYCRRRFELAAKAMDDAERVTVEAVERCPFLLPMLFVCEECILQKARIERERGRVDVMETYLERLRSVISGELPLYESRGGKKIYRDDLFDYFRCLPNLTSADFDTPDMHAAHDPDFRLQMARFMIQSVYLIPGFIISYSPTDSV